MIFTLVFILAAKQCGHILLKPYSPPPPLESPIKVLGIYGVVAGYEKTPSKEPCEGKTHLKC